MPKFLRLITPFDGPVYISPRHVTRFANRRTTPRFPEPRFFSAAELSSTCRATFAKSRSRLMMLFPKKQ
jgi:hypothetical protein